jgi:hypothetical protein
LGFGNIYQRDLSDIIEKMFIWKPKALSVFIIQIEEASTPMPKTTPAIP